MRVLFRNPGSPTNPETSIPSPRIPIQPEPSAIAHSITGTSSELMHNESDSSLEVDSASASSSKMSHQMTHQSDSLAFNNDVVQPIKSAHLRTSPNPLPTINENHDTPTTSLNTTSSGNHVAQTQIPMPSIAVSKKNGQLRFCERCNHVKPDRCHHCSECDICVLRMDQVNGCVGHKNYKFFYLFIFYTSLYADFMFAATIPILVQRAKDEKDLDIQWIVLLILAFIFGILLSGFTTVHTTYIFQNITTIESIGVTTRQYPVRIQFDTDNPLGYGVPTTQPGENLWDLGWRNNFKAAMGSKWWLWFVPLGGAQGDGLSFPYNSESYARLLNEARRQAQLQEDRIAMMMQHQHHLAQEVQSTSPMAPGATSRLRRYQ
ncbi:12718_t:CDS:2 [Ambispora gerdemannii]|uniref:Palmitoyltransferase n=1 Tax=Ambispora gerdemannii TaxID=144530 RepID=A0A9N9FVP6_9GLOM|nr:12718_t:CDS:2 [Ambispora gerdemannii]